MAQRAHCVTVLRHCHDSLSCCACKLLHAPAAALYNVASSYWQFCATVAPALVQASHSCAAAGMDLPLLDHIALVPQDASYAAMVIRAVLV